MRVARHVRVSGHVQGVFFRAWSRNEARALGVAGWIRNCSDGSVEAHVEGEPGAVEQMLNLIRQGPPGARVADVQVETEDAQGLEGFDVRH